MNDLENRIKAIENRNAKVESDKAWETSWTRRLAITSMIYGVVVLYLLVTNNSDPWTNALVASAGFFFSTPLLKFIRRVWEK